MEPTPIPKSVLRTLPLQNGANFYEKTTTFFGSIIFVASEMHQEFKFAI